MSYLRRLCTVCLPTVLLSACVVAPPHYSHSRVVTSTPVVVSQPAPVVVQQPRVEYYPAPQPVPQVVVTTPAPRMVVPVAPAPVIVSPAPTMVIRPGYSGGGHHHHHGYGHGGYGWRR